MKKFTSSLVPVVAAVLIGLPVATMAQLSMPSIPGLGSKASSGRDQYTGKKGGKKK